jgi:predicted HNH restriction endonuclease
MPSPSLIPISVSLRKRGFVHDPKAKFMTSPWVLPEKTQQALKLEASKKFNKRVDNVVDVLSKFVAIASQNFLFNKFYKAGIQKLYKNQSGRKWRTGDRCWGDIVYEQDLQVAEARKAYVNKLVAMPDAEFYEYNRKVFVEHREYRQNIGPWLEFLETIKSKRAEARANLANQKQVWQEVSVTHRPRRQQVQHQIRNRGAFSALDDSDDE